MSRLRPVVEHGLRMAGRRVDDALVLTLIREIDDELGADVSLPHLKAAFRSAAKLCGKDAMKPWMVIEAYRGSSARGAPTQPAAEVPQDEACDHACVNGVVTMCSPEGHTYAHPCDCAGGRYVRQRRRVFQTATPVHVLLLRGHAVEYPLRFSEARAEWVHGQFMAGVPARKILRALHEADERRAGALKRATDAARLENLPLTAPGTAPRMDES